TIIYETKDNSESALKVLRNFELALQKSGAKELYACNNTECGRGMPKDVFGNKQVSKRYIKADPWNMGNSINYHFWNGKLDKNGRTTYINLIVSNKNFGNYPVTITLDIVEVAEMESNLVALNPDYIKDQLKEFGKVVLSGIVFDTNKTTLKVESNKAIKIIADYLKANSDEKAYIVGHTDNQGSYNHNLQLSKGRANTVVGALISQHNISKKRLSSIGIADVSPAASNANEVSRAKNRRVEMVLQ
ncbi:MAG: OmpA family protein, partial [Kangiellaceae bacterium]|nr:OmpA family protein [Kangiellaceae bacterium]